MSFAKRHKKKLIALALALGIPTVAHGAIAIGTRIVPPPIAETPGAVQARADDPSLRFIGRSYKRRRGAVTEVRLEGTPEQIGDAHGKLLYPEMVENEGVLFGQFERYVPVPPLRWLMVDISRLNYRHVDQAMTEPRRREIAAQARAFSPDPFAGFLPTYHRFVFLQSLYDIALSFEHSPLMGCTSFAIAREPATTQKGGALLARNFDFEAGPIFDEKKAIFLIREEGRIPYASVAWPGLVGAVSGMNVDGVAVVVHGARAKAPTEQGEPVVHTMRDVLGLAKTTADAVRILSERRPMVSHMVMVADALGDVAIVERAPGAPAFVRRQKGGKVPLTNHLEGPLAVDPANKRVEQNTSTLARRKRLDELLANLPEDATVEQVVTLLRDKKGAGGASLPLGHRDAIDALIATHAVVLDTKSRSIWVSEGPHLTGRFLRFDVGRLLSPMFDPVPSDPIDVIAADEIATSGAYDAWKKAGSPHGGK